MVQAMSSEAIQAGTGHGLDHWIAFLDGRDAGSIPHREIAIILHEQGGVSEWWAQMLTVAYEQHIGRRVPGQDCDGEFNVSVTKTIHGSMDDAFEWWNERVAGHAEFSDVPISRGPNTSETAKWRYWRAGLADGSRVNVHIHQKEPGKASLSLQHEKLESPEQIEHWRSYWRQFLKNL